MPSGVRNWKKTLLFDLKKIIVKVGLVHDKQKSENHCHSNTKKVATNVIMLVFLNPFVKMLKLFEIFCLIF